MISVNSVRKEIAQNILSDNYNIFRVLDNKKNVALRNAVLKKQKDEKLEYLNRVHNTKFKYFLTICYDINFKTTDSQMRFDIISNLNKQFLIKLQRKIFTRKELRNNLHLKTFAVIESVDTNAHTHILIDLPECKRVSDRSSEYDFLSDCFLSLLKTKFNVSINQRQVKICDYKIHKKKVVDVDSDKFLREYNSFQTIYSQRDLLNSYLIKQERETLENIDNLNVKLD